MLNYMHCILSLFFTRNSKFTRLRWTGHVDMYGKIQKCLQSFSGKPEGKRPLGRPRCRWEDNIKMDLRKLGCDSGDWIALAEDRVQWWAYVRVVMNLRFP